METKVPFSFGASSSLGGTTPGSGFFAARGGTGTFSSTGTLKSFVHKH